MPCEREQLMRSLKISEEVGANSQAVAGLLATTRRKGLTRIEADVLQRMGCGR
ncbi:hypothetical protein ACWGB8_32960 [Kitasatospora sp. NPDC054939]